MTKIYRCEQGSAEWYKLRRGIPTSSMFHKVITPGGKISEQRHAYRYRLLAERLLEESMDQPLEVEWVQRGKELEPAAISNFQFQYDLELDRIGFITNDAGLVGCSPDALVKGRNEAVEVKCPAPWTQIGRLLDGIGTDYRPQVQGQLMVGQFDRCHFYSYSDRMPSLLVTTEPDLPYQKIMHRLILQFLEELEGSMARARTLGAYVVHDGYTTPHEESAPGVEPLTIIIPE